MLEMRPDCERCETDLLADKPGAHICVFECIFCDACTNGPLAGICPNCSGELKQRPVRATALLKRFPASPGRKYKANA